MAQIRSDLGVCPQYNVLFAGYVFLLFVKGNISVVIFQYGLALLNEVLVFLFVNDLSIIYIDDKRVRCFKYQLHLEIIEICESTENNKLYVFALFNSMTVKEHIVFYARLKGVSTKDTKAEIKR